MKRTEVFAAAVLFVLTAAIYAAGALRADPGIDLARSDFDVLRGWKERGRIEDLASNPPHLPKAGYLILLRALFPHNGEDPGEVRRFLVINAVAILAGLAAAWLSLARRSGSRPGLLFLTFAFLYVPARDSADYVLSEPLAIGASLLFFAGLPGSGKARSRRPISLGLACALILLLRPNLGWVLLAVALVALASEGGRRLIGCVSLLTGFLAGSALLLAAGWATGLPTNPLAVNSSKAFLWGTADYYWLPDVGVWPVGKTAEESSRLQMEKTKARWKDFLSRRDGDAARSLVWRSTHALLSAEELPPRWKNVRYLQADKLLREWWWPVAAALLAVSVIAAARGSGELRFVPLLLLLASVAQGLLFGADPRLALPFVPLAVFSLAACLQRTSWTPATAIAGGVAGALLLFVAAAVPDTTDSDFILLRGPGRRLEQEITASSFPASETATVHMRLLKPRTIALGLAITGNGEILYRRDARDASATPAYLSLLVRGQALAQARRTGLKLEVTTFGDSSEKDSFYYFPAVPGILRPKCRIDGTEDLPSGYGGKARGSVPVWVHAGTD